LTAFFEKEKAKVRGRIVMAGKHTIVPVNLNPPAKRLTELRTTAAAVLS
jgi:hypothetical protein